MQNYFLPLSRQEKSDSRRSASKMKRVFPILVSAAAGLLAAYVVTAVGWQRQIEGRAFQCNDLVPFWSNFETDTSDHQIAGCAPSPGWTWKRIERTGRIYRTVFLVLWAVTSMTLAVVCIRKQEQNKMIRNLASIALLSACLILTGCGLGSSVGPHTVSNDQDWFTVEKNGRKVEYRNWTITIDDKTIPIEKKRSVIKIEHKGGKIDIFVNDKQVHDE